MSHHIVEVQDLKFSYPDKTPALQGISFRIEHGESVAIVGANGAGKSTLLLHLNGYLTPVTGKVRIGDYPLTKETVHEARRTVGMVFQDPDDQLFMSTVFEDVAFGPLNLGLPIEEVNDRVRKALETVEVSHLKERPPHRLSAGQKRRVAIASVLSMSPDILVMDEPTSGLDPRARKKLMSLLKSFKHSKIIATHDLDMVMELCERTIVMHDGLIKADGPTQKIFLNEELLSGSHLEKPLMMQSCPLCSK
jgi:cobalt/nickel transport system ATP-binding protein